MTEMYTNAKKILSKALYYLSAQDTAEKNNMLYLKNNFSQIQEYCIICYFALH